MTNKLTLFLVTLAAVIGAGCSWWFNNNYWQKKWTARELETARAQTLMQQTIRRFETASSVTVAQIDQSQYQELQDAQKDIANLRMAVNAGTRRLQQCQQQAAGTRNTSDQPAGMGNSTTADKGTGSGQIEQDILDIGEYAVTAIKQRDACVKTYQQTQEILKK